MFSETIILKLQKINEEGTYLANFQLYANVWRKKWRQFWYEVDPKILKIKVDISPQIRGQFSPGR